MQPPRLTDISAIVKASTAQGTTGAEQTPKLRASLAIISADVAAILLAVGLVVGTRIQLASASFHAVDWLFPTIVLIAAHVLLSAWRGMYPGYGMCSISELRSTVYTITAAFAVVIVASFFSREGAPYERSIIILSWIVALPVVYAARVLVRKTLGRRPWYGTPLVVIGELAIARTIVDSLHSQAHVGLRPTLIVVPDYEGVQDEFGYHGEVPVISGTSYVTPLCGSLGIRHAIVAMPRLNATELQSLIDKISGELRFLSFASGVVHHSVIWLSNTHSPTVLHGDVEFRLRQPALRFKKRMLDIVLLVPIGLLALPLCLVIAALIKIMSPGPVLFRQTRIGRDGRAFSILKFRTMHVGAQERLKALLDSNEELQAEFNQFRKLKNDPRTTTFGSLLRRFSLDELPQLWNVVKGDMSIVGIRPYVRDEFHNDAVRGYFEYYKSVPPGLTGLWQVTVRNSAGIDERVSIDRYYLHNWSLFLDIYILAKTFSAVLRGRGAY
jgi:Undecaprenyl-phosphate galactose phosphotransferase WbaP